MSGPEGLVAIAMCATFGVVTTTFIRAKDPLALPRADTSGRR